MAYSANIDDHMDDIDRKILDLLQKNGRISNHDLAQAVHLSPSPCLRRVKKLEKNGIIKGYSARVDRTQYGLPISVFAMIKLASHDAETIAQLEALIGDIDEIVDCYLMAGSHDYLLHIVAATLSDYEAFMKARLNTIDGIASIESNIAFGTIKQSSPLPAPPTG